MDVGQGQVAVVVHFLVGDGQIEDPFVTKDAGLTGFREDQKFM